MAAKKSKKKTASGASGKTALGNSPLGLLQDLLSEIPEEARLDLLSSIMGGPPPAHLSMPAKAKPRTKAQVEIERLLSQARTQFTASEAVPFLVQAEQLAKQAIGKQFDKLVGRMGEHAAGDVYLDVKIQLAQALRAIGQHDATLAHLQDVYRLDSSDPYEVRCDLLAAYFDLDRNEDAERLLQEDCPEPWADWHFGRLLVDLRRSVRGPLVDEQLQVAHVSNPFVISLLLGERMPDAVPPESIEPGDDGEAQDIAVTFLPAWRNTPGATSWLREAAARLGLEISPPDDEQPEPRRLTARDYARMPAHTYPTWIAGIHEIGMSQLPGEDHPSNHWLTFAFAPGSELIGFDIGVGPPTAGDLWNSLTEFMLDEQQPGRPAKLMVHPPVLVAKLKKEAARAKIELAPLERSDELAAMLSQLTDRMVGGAQAAESLDPAFIQQAPLDVDEVWEAAVVEMEQRLSVGGHSLRPSVALVMSRVGGVILWHELFTESPPADALANAVRMAIGRPAIGPARRPRQVVVRDHDEAVSLRALSDEAGFDCTVERELPLIADAVARVTQDFLGGEPAVVLTKGEGTTPADLERYYTAATAYYRSRPWKQFAMDELIGLAFGDAPNQRRYALVMGQSGLTMGLAIYERLQDVETMFSSMSDQQAFDSFSVMFGEMDSIAPADHDAIEQFGWPIAAPEAYPDALRIHPGPTVVTPTGRELRFLAAALEAIAWLAQHRDQKSTTVPFDDALLISTRLGCVGTVRE